MAHVLIVGMTMSGKTTLAKSLAAEYKKKGIPVLVLDPMNDPGWNADVLSRNPQEFLQIAKANRGCALFIDESGQSIGKFSGHLQWLATTSRHFGHRAHFICQRIQQIDVTMRDQCSDIFIFTCSQKDAELLATEFAKPELAEAHNLGQFEYFHTGRFQEVQKLST